MSTENSRQIFLAAERFRQARRRVLLREFVQIVGGRSPDLLSFEAVHSALKTRQQVEQREPQVIPLDKIVGSVGRYRDFTREFLPKATVNETRWKTVDVIMHGPTGLPPIEVYQIGDVYFVRDGHHRVSVARANNLDDIEAYVTLVQSPVPITVDTRPEDLVLKAAYADFLRQTQLHELHPDADVEVTELGGYLELLNHIEVHRHYLGLDQAREIPYQDAVASWYERVYLPVAAAVWASNIMEQFPDRTAADLYLWVCRHREELAKDSGEVPSPVETVVDLVQEEHDATAKGVIGSVKRVLGIEAGPGTSLAAEAAETLRRPKEDDGSAQE